MEVKLYMKTRRLTAAFLALACLCVGLGVWAVSAQVQVGRLRARIAALEVSGEAPVESDPGVVVAEFNGGVVTAAEAAAEYAVIANYYDMMGMDEAEYAENAKYTVLNGLAENKILEMKAREAGVYELDESQRAEIAQRVKAEYEDNIEYYMAFRFDGSKSDAQVREETIAYLDENGYSYESMLAEAEKDAWKDRLFEYVTQDISVDDEQLRSFFEEQAVSAEMAYSADFAEYEMAVESGRPILWHPQGVRRIEYIMHSFDAELQADYLMLQAALDGGDSSKLAELDALYESLLPAAQDTVNRLNAGESFEALASGVMHVSEQSALCGDAVRDAAMALENVGDVSVPVRTDGGICILRYAGDVPAGKAAYEDVKDALLATYEAEYKSSRYNAAVVQWINDAQIRYYIDRF